MFLHMVPLPLETLCRPAGVQCPAGHPQLQKLAVYGSLWSSEFSGIADLAPKILMGWLQEIKKHKTSPHEQCSNRHLWHLPFLNLVVSESLILRYLGVVQTSKLDLLWSSGKITPGHLRASHSSLVSQTWKGSA